MNELQPGAAAGAVGQVIAHVERIVFDELQPGDQLPSEGDLAQQLGVSRLTVREGVKQLSARGLVETHNGRKPVVAAPNGQGVGDYFRSAIRRDPHSILDLLEVRLAIETHNASLAARHATRPNIDAMTAAIEDMARNLHDRDKFSDADIRFHEQLAVATGNKMLATLIEELSAVLKTSREASTEGHARRGLSLDEVLAQHMAILECVRNRDGAGAATAMRRHLRQTKKDLAAAL